ncbi:hypothetical protein [uncultured Tateyamaria sp.]|uniref:hypothetical protein n=1 Tax=uncultured Tateyamaria sp. TaxID=455651 RepID=UPI00263A3765|nr:hypothetical protein [uncultured Tateyamaria sp.]
MKRLSDLCHFGRFNAKVPRLESYPPANWFSEGINADPVRTWQSNATEDAEISLYFHIPFWRRLCWFCGCRTGGTRKTAPFASYVERVLSKAADQRRSFVNGVGPKRPHMGSGTATILSASLLDRLLRGLDDI